MADIILHLGPHKTGTTYLQQRFLDNAANLEARGIRFPTDDLSMGPGQHALAHALMDGGQARESAISNIVGYANTASRLLLSSELFSLFDHSTWNELLSALRPRHSIRFAVFLRRRIDGIYSMWQEAIKWGRTTLLPEFVASRELDAKSDAQLSPFDLLMRLAVTANDIDVVLYDELAERNVDIFNFFCSAILGEEPRHFAKGAGGSNINKGFDPEFIEILRLMNAITTATWPSIAAYNALTEAYDRSPRVRADVHELRQRLTPFLYPLDLGYLDRDFADRDADLLAHFAVSILNPRADGKLWPAAPTTKTFVAAPPQELAPIMRSVRGLHQLVLEA